MKVKFANKVFEVLYTKEVAGQNMYAVEDEPNHIDWLVNVEVVDAEKKELKKIHVIDEGKSEMDYCFTKMMNGEKVSPTWSEDDERICHAIICDIANDKSICKFEISKSICDEQINWLKSLKERIGG